VVGPAGSCRSVQTEAGKVGEKAMAFRVIQGRRNSDELLFIVWKRFERMAEERRVQTPDRGAAQSPAMNAGARQAYCPSINP
jgi:hypothetical protein